MQSILREMQKEADGIKIPRKLRKALDRVEAMNAEQLSALLDVMEAGVPERFRHLLVSGEKQEGRQ